MPACDISKVCLDFKSCGSIGPGLPTPGCGISTLTQLQYLGLGGTGVTDAGLEQLSHQPHLQGLTLDRTKVTDAGLKLLEGRTQFQQLDLGGTTITDDGCVIWKG